MNWYNTKVVTLSKHYHPFHTDRLTRVSAFTSGVKSGSNPGCNPGSNPACEVGSTHIYPG